MPAPNFPFPAELNESSYEVWDEYGPVGSFYDLLEAENEARSLSTRTTNQHCTVQVETTHLRAQLNVYP